MKYLKHKKLAFIQDFSLAQDFPEIIEKEEFITYTAARQQVAVKKVWLPVLEPKA